MAKAELVAKWRDRVERSQGSGLSVADFCRQEGFSTATFYAWRRRITGNGSGRKHRGVEFVEVGGTDGIEAVDIIVGSPMMVRVDPGFDEATLRRVLAVLRDRE